MANKQKPQISSEELLKIRKIQQQRISQLGGLFNLGILGTPMTGAGKNTTGKNENPIVKQINDKITQHGRGRGKT